jgi:serine/threonine protein kinase
MELDFRRDVDPNGLYELSLLLGEGSYGAVYKALSRSTKTDVAIKIIPDADDDLTALWREIRFLQVLRSPFVVSFIESLLYDNELWLVMELCDGGSLFDLKEAYTSRNMEFEEEQLKCILAFSTLGLAHLHSQRSIHRDVKSGNILLCKEGRVKLGDFGISAQLTDTIMKRRTVIGSPYWMAPEVIQVGVCVCVWVYGCVCVCVCVFVCVCMAVWVYGYVVDGCHR